MDTKTIVKYASLAVAVIALVSLVGSAPVQVVLLVAVAGVDKFYTKVL